METTSVKVQVDSETYTVLIETQQKLKKETGKKTSLAVILHEYVRIGIRKAENEQNNSMFAQNVEQKTQNSGNFAQEKGDFAQNNNENRKNNLLSSINLSNPSTKEQKRLDKKLKYLDDREDAVRDLESELIEERDNLYNQKLDFLENINQFHILKTQLVEKDKFIEFLQAQLTTKTDFSQIKELFSDNQDVFLTSFDKLENLHENNTEIAKRYFEENQERMKLYHDSLLDLCSSKSENKIMKFIPLASAILIPLMIKNANSESKKEIIKLQDDIKNIISNDSMSI